MNRTHLISAACALALAPGAVLALDAGAGEAHVPAARAASAGTIKLASTSAGKIVVSKSDRTLYFFTHDTLRHDTCVSISMCASNWPPYTVTGRPSAGSGLKSRLLGTIKLPNGKKQVTYAGHALYTYKFDSGPKQTDYIGAVAFGGTWYALNAAGKPVT